MTGGFLHDGILHIAFNMFFLYFMGAMLEPAIGRAELRRRCTSSSLLAGSFGALLFAPQARPSAPRARASGCSAR